MYWHKKVVNISALTLNMIKFSCIKTTFHSYYYDFTATTIAVPANNDEISTFQTGDTKDLNQRSRVETGRGEG